MIQKTLAEHKLFIFTIAIFIVSQAFLFSKDIGWDDSVYIGMGKYIFSSGKIGLWEGFRPPFFPFIIGFFWKLGFGIITYKIIAMLFGTALLLIAYKILLMLYDKKTSALSAFIIAATPIYLFNAARVLTDIPSAFFSLAAIYLFIRKRFIFSGFITSIAILTRFPQGIVAILLIITLFYKKQIFDFFRYLLGLIPLLFMYLVSNKIIYNSFFLPLIKANEAATKSAQWLYSGGYFFYFSSLVEENILLIFSLVGTYFIFKKRQLKRTYFILAPAVMFLIYFTLLTHKELRYSLAFLPYIAMLSSCGIIELHRFIKKIKFQYFVSALIIIFVISSAPQYSYYSKQKIEDPALKEFLKENTVSGAILTSNPRIAAYTNNKITPYYYLFEDATQIYEENKMDSSIIVYDSSAFPCNDDECIRKKMKLFDKIYLENKLIYRKGTLYIFSRS